MVKLYLVHIFITLIRNVIFEIHLCTLFKLNMSFAKHILYVHCCLKSKTRKTILNNTFCCVINIY